MSTKEELSQYIDELVSSVEFLEHENSDYLDEDRIIQMQNEVTEIMHNACIVEEILGDMISEICKREEPNEQ